MNWLKKKYVLFILLSVFIGFINIGVYSQESNSDNDYKILAQYQDRILNVPYIQQPPGTQWCWAASAAMVLRTYGVDAQTEQVVQAIFHVLNPNQPGSEQDILQGLSIGGVKYKNGSRIP